MRPSKTLEALTHEAADELGLAADFEKVADPAEIASWGHIGIRSGVCQYGVVLVADEHEVLVLVVALARARGRPGSTVLIRPFGSDNQVVFDPTFPAPAPTTWTGCRWQP